MYEITAEGKSLVMVHHHVGKQQANKTNQEKPTPKTNKSSPSFHHSFPQNNLSHKNVMTLQRTIGNQATVQLFQRKQKILVENTTIQRSEETDSLRGFANKFATLIKQLQTDGQDKNTAEAVEELISDAQAIGLDDSNPTMYNKLETLQDFAMGQSQIGLRQILSSFNPDSMSGDNAFTSAAAASLSPMMGKAGTDGYDALGFSENDASGIGAEASAELDALADSDLTRDEKVAESRINLVTSKIAEAYAHHLNNYDNTDTPFDKTVLVFMGPEWFFNEGTHPVSREEKERIIEEFRTLSTLYPQMVIVPGTILSGDPYFKKKGFLKTKRKFIGNYNNLTNTAPVLWNGNILKTIDKAGIGGDTKEIMEVFNYNQATSKEKFWQGGDESAFFNLGDVKFAIDICVDHFSGRAKSELESIQEENNEVEGADIHLVTAAGSNFDINKSALKSTGVGFGADVGGAESSGKKADGSQITGAILGTDNEPDAERKRGRKDWFKYYNSTPIIHVVDAIEGSEIDQEPAQ